MNCVTAKTALIKMTSQQVNQRFGIGFYLNHSQSRAMIRAQNKKPPDSPVRSLLSKTRERRDLGIDVAATIKQLVL